MAKKRSKKSYNGFRRWNKIRSNLWKWEKDSFTTYAETAKVASAIYQANDKKYIRSKKELHDLLQKVTKKPQKPKPQISSHFLGTFMFYELDETIASIRDDGYRGEIRSDLSLIPAFLILNYSYNDTFKDFVDFHNNHQPPYKSGDAPSIIIDLFYDEEKEEWYLGVEEETPSAYVRVKKENIITQIAKNKRGLDTKKEEKITGGEKIKKINLKESNLHELRETFKLLGEQKAQAIEELKFFNEANDKTSFKKTAKVVRELNEQMRKINLYIGNLTRGA